MNKLINSPEHQELARCLCEKSALYTLSWGRDDSDNYNYNIKPLNMAISPSIDEIGAIFPSGSKWSMAKGWRNIFGIPFLLHGQSFIAVGVESVYPHHRGATPALDAHIYPIAHPPINGIMKAIATIGVADSDSSLLNTTHGIIRTSSRTPREHRQIESNILRHALTSYNKQERLLFATLLLTEDRLKMPGSPGILPKSPSNNFVLNYEQYLIATSPSLESSFSFYTKAWLKAVKRLW